MRDSLQSESWIELRFRLDRLLGTRRLHGLSVGCGIRAIR
jgi:hypothetical protein